MHDDLEKFLKQATRIQDQMKKTNSKLVQQEVTGVAGGGMIKITMNGRHDVLRVDISDELMDDREILEDMVAGAINDAVRKVDKVNEAAIEDLAVGMPSFDFLK
ncbi:MAG: YbaB/EbfC family nucleoid-associated protein [Gammaproteobacteria bacterium]|nr:YbaB/EbfC family nucleoid-associated protein [Gammaproteobacteria bacterium]MYD78407.1 YbaB/EbfC family nucleoid-associated protein [Gammaproteobacteria bacterium]MYI89462.1 YbaB/EbfC family nucleoid-associated protein [Gammaproteobacteria bacterium]